MMQVKTNLYEGGVSTKHITKIISEKDIEVGPLEVES